MSESTLALYAQRSAHEMPVRTTIPFEKTRRSPRFVNWRGKNLSRARRAARRGNPWYEVFAANTSTASVSTCTTQYMNPSTEDAGKTPRAISESTEGVPPSLGRASIWTASHETPTNIVIAIAPRIASVLAAFFPCGLRNAFTPFAIASTPVRAVEPEANARRTTNVVTAPSPAVSGCETVASGQPVVAHLVTPTPINAKIDATNVYVGSANTRPASLTPRRFAIEIRTTQRRESDSTWLPSDGTADVSARTPAATETATVST